MPKHNKKGRNKSTESFVKLDRSLLKSEAYQHLEPYAARLLPLMMSKYHGPATNEIIMGQREAAAKLNCSQPTAARALKDLLIKGFIRTKQAGHFDFKSRHATTWTITMLQFNNQLATKEFLNWKPIQKKSQHKKLTPSAKESCSEAPSTLPLQ
jgi:hypothetical protein